MNLREQNYTMEFEYGRIRPFEEGILTSGSCDFSLPMRFVRYHDKTVVKYDAAGYLALSELIPENTRSLLEILEMTMIMLKRSKEYLIVPNKIVLNKDTVFYNTRTGDVRIAYIAGEAGILTEKIIEFIQSFKEGESRETIEVLDRISKTIRENNMSINDIVDLLGEERRDLSLRNVTFQ